MTPARGLSRDESVRSSAPLAIRNTATSTSGKAALAPRLSVLAWSCLFCEDGGTRNHGQLGIHQAKLHKHLYDPRLIRRGSKAFEHPTLPDVY